jgi:hypothetical protein
MRGVPAPAAAAGRCPVTLRAKPGEWLELTDPGRCLRLSREPDGRLRIGVEDEDGVAEIVVEVDEEPMVAAFIGRERR